VLKFSLPTITDNKKKMFSSTAAQFPVLFKYKSCRAQSFVLRSFLPQKRGPVLTGYLVICHSSAVLLKRSSFPAVSCILDALCAFTPMGSVGINRENIDICINCDDDDDSSLIITTRGICFYYDYYC